MRSSSSPARWYDRHIDNNTFGFIYHGLAALMITLLTLWGFGIIPPKGAFAGTSLSLQPSQPEDGALERMLNEAPPYIVKSRVLKGTFKRAQADMGSFASCHSRLTVALNAVRFASKPYNISIISLTPNSQAPDTECTAVFLLTQGSQQRQCDITAPATADSVLTCEDKPLQLYGSTIQRPGYLLGAY